MATNKFSGKNFAAALQARKMEERAVILALVIGLLAYAWLMFVHDVMKTSQEDLSRRITVTNSQIIEQTNRQAEIQGTFTQDPNSFALTKQRELQVSAQEADERLNRLYGELISPQQMSIVLTSILQRETTLELISLENQPSETLVSSAVPDSENGNPAASVEVFKHGLRMVFEGNFLETIRYLRSLEELDSNFFWENLEFQVNEYPNARISLDIYTLSTQRGWIGV